MKLSNNESARPISMVATGQDTVSVVGQSSTDKPLADGNASQSNPRLPVELLSRNGKIKAFVGAVAMFNCKACVCVKIDGVHSFWKHEFNGEVFQEKLNLSEIVFKDIGSHEFFKPWTGQRLLNFIAASPAVAVEQIKQQPETETENNMAKKIKTEKKAKTAKVGGKIAFVDELLLAGKHTKAEVAAQLEKKFGVPEKTAKNTVSWAASTMKGRIGKESKHLPKVGATDSEKPAKKKVAAKKPVAKKKTAMPKRKQAPDLPPNNPTASG